MMQAWENCHANLYWNGYIPAFRRGWNKTFHSQFHYSHYIQNVHMIVFCFVLPWHGFNTLRPRQNGRLFADDTFKRFFLNENNRISVKISLKFVPMGLINNIPALVLTMAWRRPGDKPLPEPMMVRSLTHICVTRPQWVNALKHWGRGKWPPFHWRHIQNVFLNENVWISPNFVPKGSISNILALVLWLVYLHLYASLPQCVIVNC